MSCDSKGIYAQGQSLIAKRVISLEESADAIFFCHFTWRVPAYTIAFSQSLSLTFQSDAMFYNKKLAPECSGANQMGVDG